MISDFDKWNFIAHGECPSCGAQNPPFDYSTLSWLPMDRNSTSNTHLVPKVMAVCTACDARFELLYQLHTMLELPKPEPKESKEPKEPKEPCILFVDDKKLPEWFGLLKGTRHAETYTDAIRAWHTKLYDTLYLDYDLDQNYNGADLLLILLQYKTPKKVYCISINQTGGPQKIRDICESRNIPFEDIGKQTMFDKFTIISGQGG